MAQKVTITPPERPSTTFKDFKPLCLNHHDGDTPEGYAHTSTGYLVPCCHLDYINNIDPMYLDLLKEELKLENNESVEDILLSDEWLTFAEAVVKGYDKHIKYAPPSCMFKCGIRDE